MESAEYLHLQGHALSVAEVTALTCSLRLLSKQADRPARFWGKVLGSQGADYLIAQCSGAEFLDPPTSYYSIDGGTRWTELEVPSEQQNEFSAQIRGPFSGDPKYEYKLQKDIPPEEPSAADLAAKAAEEAALADKAEDEEPAEDAEGEEGDDAAEAPDAAGGGDEEEGEEEKKAPKRRPKFQILTMKESARLSYFIIEHDRACSLVPRGSVLRGQDNVIVTNRGFRGLPVEEAVQLRSYFKRSEQYDLKENAALFADQFMPGRDFLRSIAHDVPVGIWALKYDDNSGIVVVHNLLFLGSLFFYKAGTTTCGQVYVGNGERNLDLLFMLP